ncbi:22823_t:CDS:2 [Rhizophagus irregularis]|nr:22823_t:CDS:2 [Rhizophagus irregularis]
MPALPFDWNIKGFNDTAVANCPNGVVHQIQAAIIANLVANGATNHGNKNILFIFFETVMRLEELIKRCVHEILQSYGEMSSYNSDLYVFNLRVTRIICGTVKSLPQSRSTAFLILDLNWTTQP